MRPIKITLENKKLLDLAATMKLILPNGECTDQTQSLAATNHASCKNEPVEKPATLWQSTYLNELPVCVCAF